jgi:hypothetical protein
MTGANQGPPFTAKTVAPDATTATPNGYARPGAQSSGDGTGSCPNLEMMISDWFLDDFGNPTITASQVQRTSGRKSPKSGA